MDANCVEINQARVFKKGCVVRFVITLVGLKRLFFAHVFIPANTILSISIFNSYSRRYFTLCSFKTNEVLRKFALSVIVKARNLKIGVSL